ncbi:MAG: hypothetical protein IPL65_16025 [Lewinellaceae bacterium]|nr:hypothetical protein [Lewinellaceae bacterium]
MAKITRDLKGKPLEDLYWQLDGQINVDPFPHPDDLPDSPSPLTMRRGWEICESIDATVPTANATALSALEAGAEALCIHLPSTGYALESVLKGVHLDLIGLHFSGPGLDADPLALLKALEKTAVAQGIKASALHGSLWYNPVASEKPCDWPQLTALLSFATAHFPGFRCLQVGAAPGAATLDKVVQPLLQANMYCTGISRLGLPTADVLASIGFSFTVGTDFFTAIAAQRALRLCWMNLQKSWGLPVSDPDINTGFDPGVYSDDLYTNMIRATTMAMSAVLGGAQTLTVLPYDAGREGQSDFPEAFSRRIARNVQHLLKMESFLDQFEDPAAGSYYLENLSRQLGAAAWAKFGQDQT